MGIGSRAASAVLFASLSFVVATHAQEPTATTIRVRAPGLADYRKLQRCEFTTRAHPLPAAGLHFQLDAARWHLEQGTLRLMRALSDGAVTGLTFRGRGRFEMEVPDPVERAQLRRFAEDRTLEAVDTVFSELVLRTSGPLVRELFPNATPGAAGEASPRDYRVDELAKKRHELWIERRRFDVDARILAALRDPGDFYWRAEMRTEDWDWITFEFDAGRTEELRLVRQHPRRPEVWVSLDREEQRAPSGRPSGKRDAHTLLRHVEIEADLTKSGANSRVGRSRARVTDGRFDVALTLEPRKSGASTLTFELHPRAEVTAVTDASGHELAFLRDHIGDRSIRLDDAIYDDGLVVLLERPLTAGEPLTLRVRYRLKILDFVRGKDWYPTIRHNHLDRHTARLSLTAPKKADARGMGQLVEEREDEDDDTRTRVFRIDAPTPMVTFTLSRSHREERVRIDGVPEVVSVGPVFGLAGGGKLREVCENVAESISFFQELFDADLPEERILVSSIAAGHGQSFDGFLQLSETTLYAQRRGVAELFRAHEVAHQWWGHRVGWRTYRDVWLSEAFAEYSAMMFIERELPDGDELVQEIRSAYQNMLHGSIRSVMSKFSRPGLIEMNAKDRARVGPIDVGPRASTKDVPGGFFLQVYHKGPLVLHMLRRRLASETGSDDTFIATLRDFQRAYRGELAGTDDFRAILEERAGGDWGWFFDQWIYRAEIPSYRFRVEGGKGRDPRGGYPMSLVLEPSDDTSGFVLRVPVEVELANRKVERFDVSLDPETSGPQRFDRVLPARMKGLVVNAGDEVLARFRER